MPYPAWATTIHCSTSNATSNAAPFMSAHAQKKRKKEHARIERKETESARTSTILYKKAACRLGGARDIQLCILSHRAVNTESTDSPAMVSLNMLVASSCASVGSHGSILLVQTPYLQTMQITMHPPRNHHQHQQHHQHHQQHHRGMFSPRHAKPHRSRRIRAARTAGKTAEGTAERTVPEDFDGWRRPHQCLPEHV